MLNWQKILFNSPILLLFFPKFLLFVNEYPSNSQFLSLYPNSININHHYSNKFCQAFKSSYIKLYGLLPWYILQYNCFPARASLLRIEIQMFGCCIINLKLKYETTNHHFVCLCSSPLLCPISRCQHHLLQEHWCYLY